MSWVYIHIQCIKKKLHCQVYPFINNFVAAYIATSLQSQMVFVKILVM